MGLIQWAESKTKGLTIWDIGVLKIYCVLFGVIVGAIASTFVQKHLWWFVAGVVVLGLGLGFRWFTAAPE